jgi:hypothetical protein
VDEVLKTSRRGTVVRVGDTVRRPQYPWSASVHALLLHLEDVGFPRSPRFLGVDDEDREVLSFIDGVAGADGYVDGVVFGAHVWAMVATAGGLERFARLLREYHDAVRDFRPAADAPWSSGTGAPGIDELICHNDFGPWNVVWVDSRPVGIIDWDYAAPGSPTADVAYALEWAVPFCSDEECIAWRRFDEPPDRRRRIELFATAYGLADTGGLVEAVLARQHAFRQLVIDLGSKGLQPAADELESGYLDQIDARIRWTEDHRHLLE